jgi:hypothetical protein
MMTAVMMMGHMTAVREASRASLSHRRASADHPQRVISPVG